MPLRRCATASVLAAIALTLLASTAPAVSSPYAPLNRPGPRLTVPQRALRASLRCTPGLTHTKRNPVLLVPGTNLDPGSNYSWNYERALAAMSWTYCTVTLPFHAMGDIQVAGQYVVHALRTMARLSKRRVDVLGYSQGGMVPRWALRFWPGTRPLVHDLVGIDPSNHGTLDAAAACQQRCPPAYWQQATGSHFLTALNSRAETFAGIDYTVIFSRTDEVVVPNLDARGSSSLHTGSGRIANIAVQSICPSDSSEHLAMGTYDPVAYALAIDAFTHSGTASAARISHAVCLEPFQPAVNPSTFATDYAGFLGAIGKAFQQSPQVAAEPRLACYVFASCPTASRRSTHKGSHKHHH